MRFTRPLLIAVLSATAAIAAHADPISGAIGVTDLSGTFAYNSAATTSTINFGPNGFVTSLGNATGSSSNTFGYFAPGNSIAFNTTPFNYASAIGGTINSAGTQIFTDTQGGELLTFFMTSETTLMGTDMNDIVLSGTGYFTETCVSSSCGVGNVNYSQTVANFTVAGSTVNGAVFNIGGTAQTPSVTPEPSSLILLGTGIVGVAGAFRRKFVKV